MRDTCQQNQRLKLCPLHSKGAPESPQQTQSDGSLFKLSFWLLIQNSPAAESFYSYSADTLHSTAYGQKR